METLGADMTTHLATHAITTESVGMTGMIIIKMTDTMDTDMTDVIGAAIIISGLGDNKVRIVCPRLNAGVFYIFPYLYFIPFSSFVSVHNLNQLNHIFSESVTLHLKQL